MSNIIEMDQSFNCLLLIDDSLIPIPIYNDDNKINKHVMLNGNKVDMNMFTVALLNDYICKKKNVDNLKLWKVNVKKEDIKDKVSTEEDIKNKLKGEVMEPSKLFKRYFQVDSQDEDEEFVENIHIIAFIPTTGPNWNDASSIYEWIQQFTLNRGRGLLVKTYGKDFEFLQRDDTIDALWNGLTMLDGIAVRLKNRNKSDKGLHPIPVLAGGPGVGKSRFLDEVERLLGQYAKESDDEEIRDAFTNMTVINTTYGNGCPARDMDVTIGAEASLAIRILFEYFKPKHDYGNFDFSHFQSLCNNYSNISSITLSTAIRVVYADIIIQKNQEINSNPLLVLVLGIDEFNKLHDINPDVCRKLIKAIGGVMCYSPVNIYFIPILAGIIEGPLNQYISGSMHDPLPLPLRLLEDDDAIAIGKAMGLVDDQYVRCHPYFRMSIGDVGGHVRTLECFYKSFEAELNKRKGEHNKIKMASIMDDVKHAVKNKYRLDSYSKWLIVPLAKAILGLPVNKDDTIEFDNKLMDYRELSSMGVLNLAPINKGKKTINYNVRLPYIWVDILVQSSEHTGMNFWKSMIDYDEPMYWQNFERFNANFWVLRLSLFRLLGYQQIDLKELLKGAKFSRKFPNVKVSLPENLEICKLRRRYPGTGDKKEDNEMEDDDDTEDDNGDDTEDDNDDDTEDDNDDDTEDDNDDDTEDDKMDVDYKKMDYPYSDISKNISYTFLNADGAVWDVFEILKITSGFLCIAKQVKLTSADAKEPMIINQALFDNEHTKVTEAMKNVPVEEWVLLFLPNADTQSLSIKMNENSALVSKNEFLAFYGYTYTNRAQFASANEKIYINSTDKDSLKILGFNKKERRRICKERQKRYLANYDEIKTRIRISAKRFRKLKRDDRISFSCQ